MAYQVMFSGQSLKDVQKAAVDYVKTVPGLKLCGYKAKQTDQGAFLIIGLVKNKPKE